MPSWLFMLLSVEQKYNSVCPLNKDADKNIKFV